jgi:pimeloyl-ACP methyl ester carboxylesterase
MPAPDAPAVPFHRGRFEDLPALPRRPHRYFETRATDVPVTTPALGRVRTHVRIHGAGPPLLLVHGLMTSSYSWRYVLEPLGAHYTLYIPDLPGAGRSEGPLAPAYHPRAIADWLGALQGELGIRGCRVIGNSMGGYLCMWLALRDPGAISRLLNVHSPGVPEMRLYALRALLALPGARKVLSAWIRRDTLRWAHANVHYWDESLKSIEEAHEYGDPLATDAGARAFIKYLAETMAVGDIREFQRTLRERRLRAEPFPVPLLHMFARRDPMVPARFGGVLAEATGAPLVWLDEASHFAHVDATERFVAGARDFLRG